MVALLIIVLLFGAGAVTGLFTGNLALAAVVLLIAFIASFLPWNRFQ